MKRRIAAFFAASLLSAGTTMAADDITIHSSADPMLKLGTVTFDGGRSLDLTVGIGSGAFRHPSLPANIFQSVSDRGPNFTCKDGIKITATTQQQLCGGMKGARIYPTPNYVPSIYTVEVLPGGSFRILDVLTLKDRDGKPITGLTNPMTKAKTEIPFDSHGRKLAQDPNAIDMEGLVRLADGTYWVGEENAPSIVHIDADGRIIKRLVPKGMEGDFAGANYTVEGKLPALLARRQTNRGIESMAVSPDEKFLYFAVQSPLANPDAKTYAASANTRLFKFDRAGETLVGEFLYVFDKPETFIKDKSKKQSDVKLSEMMATGLDRVIVLERINKTTKLYEVALDGATNVLGTAWDAAATTPSLEATPVDRSKIVPLAKVLKFTTDQHKNFPDKIEGLARLGDGSTAMINDDDFGIEGARTTIAVVKELRLVSPAAALSD